MGKLLSYDSVRDDIKNGDIVFFTNDGSFNNVMISFFSRSKYVHVAVLFWVDFGTSKRLMVIESDATAKRRIFNFSYYDGREAHIMSAPRPWDEYSEDALGKIGTVKYKISEAVHIGFRDFMLKYFGVKIKRRDFEGEVCSEMVSRMLGFEDNSVSPGKLSDRLHKLGHEFKAKIRI